MDADLGKDELGLRFSALICVQIIQLVNPCDLYMGTTRS
jgi:hypothetical protein